MLGRMAKEWGGIYEKRKRTANGKRLSAGAVRIGVCHTASEQTIR